MGMGVLHEVVLGVESISMLMLVSLFRFVSGTDRFLLKKLPVLCANPSQRCLIASHNDEVAVKLSEILG
jgi:hypothetical protein